MAHSDTTPEARKIQIETYRKMSGAERLLLAFDISELTRALARAGIRDRHPEWSESEVTRELLRLAFFPSPRPVRLR
jgi:hypothetical protein